MSRRFVDLVGAAAPLVLVLASAQAFAWAPIEQCGSAYTHWAPGNPNTTWVYSTSFPSSDLSSSIVTARLGSAFAEWAKPGCTEFNAAQGSSASGDPMGSSSLNLIGFYESSWPSSLGGSDVLAVTFTTWTSSCVIPEADMVINGRDFTWVDGLPSNGNQADLQAIVTHEAGHWVGLDHSTFTGSSLNAYYSGGLGERTLTCDDTTAICTINPNTGLGCANDNYCPCGIRCESGSCDGEPVDPGGSCSGSAVSANEAEPNDWEGDTDVNLFQPSGGGDFTVNGTLTCGNDGESYTADYDWFVIDFPCTSSARFTLDWSGNSDLDFQVWDSNGEGLTANYDSGYEGPTFATETAGGRTFILVTCWDGQTTSYSMTVDWTPFSPIDTGGNNPGDDTADSPNVDSGTFDTGDRLLSCLCTQGGSWQGALPGAWLLLVGLGTIRRRGSRLTTAGRA